MVFCKILITLSFWHDLDTNELTGPIMVDCKRFCWFKKKFKYETHLVETFTLDSKKIQCMSFTDM